MMEEEWKTARSAIIRETCTRNEIQQMFHQALTYADDLDPTSNEFEQALDEVDVCWYALCAMDSDSRCL